MSRTLDIEYKMRMTQELKDKIVVSAKEHSRSMNADIVARLEQSFDESYEQRINEMYNKMYNERLSKVIQEVVVGIMGGMVSQGVPAEKINAAAMTFVENMGNAMSSKKES